MAAMSLWGVPRSALRAPPEVDAQGSSSARARARGATVGVAAAVATRLGASLLPLQDPPPADRPRSRINLATAFFKMLLRFFILLRWRVKGLRVEMLADSNRQALRGTLRSVFLSFDKLQLARAQFTSGGVIEIAGLDLTLRSLIRHLIRGRVRFLKRPFELYVQGDMNRDDVANSWWIRNIAQRVVNIIMTRAGGTDLTIMTVSVRAASVVADRLVFSGVIGTALSTSVPFVVSIGLSVAGSGHILCVTDPEIVLNPGPLQVVVPIVTIRQLEVDLGDNARVEQLLVTNSMIRIRARTLVSPYPKFLVADPAPRCMFSYDLADFVGRFLGVRPQLT